MEHSVSLFLLAWPKYNEVTGEAVEREFSSAQLLLSATPRQSKLS